MELDDNMKELIQRLEDLKLLTTDAQLHKADEIWGRLLVLIMKLRKQNYSKFSSHCIIDEFKPLLILCWFEMA